jgi:hypothetical protein
MRHKPTLFILAAIAAAALSGCAGSGETTERLLVAPDKFMLYRCDDLGAAYVRGQTRERELQALIAKAGPSSAGTFVSNIAYEPEYVQLRGEMAEVRRTAAEKKCDLDAAAAAAAPRVAAEPPQQAIPVALPRSRGR